MTVTVLGRRPLVDPTDLVAALVPPPHFDGATLDTYLPDPAHPSQAQALAAVARFAAPHLRRLRLGKRGPGVGIYLDGGFGVGKTHLLAALWHLAPGRKYFGTFIEYTALVGALGYANAVALLRGATLVAIDG